MPMLIQDLCVGNYYAGSLWRNKIFWAFVTEATPVSKGLDVVFQYVQNGTVWQVERMIEPLTYSIQTFDRLAQKLEVLAAGFPECPDEVAVRLGMLMNAGRKPPRTGYSGPTFPGQLPTPPAVQTAPINGITIVNIVDDPAKIIPVYQKTGMKAGNKVRIPENSSRVACFKCFGPNKTIQLFTGTTNYCPVCEP